MITKTISFTEKQNTAEEDENQFHSWIFLFYFTQIPFNKLFTSKSRQIYCFCYIIFLALISIRILANPIGPPKSDANSYSYVTMLYCWRLLFVVADNCCPACKVHIFFATTKRFLGISEYLKSSDCILCYGIYGIGRSNK